FDLANLRRDLAADVGRFAGATVLAEVMLKMAPPAPLPAAYDAFTTALDALAGAAPDAIDAAGVRGIWLLLGVLGFEPSLGTCVRDGTTIDPDGRDPVTFSVAEGGVACPTCAPAPPLTRLPRQAYRGLLVLNDAAADLPRLDAPHPLGDHVQASVVDVPGHEGFVRNMLAGATGIDVALLVVAADEGLMPQTEEHLAIIELLGVGRGIPVITKQDLVEPEWLDLVRSEVSERLKRSRVPWEPSIATSALTGEGLDELRSALRLVANDLVERPAEDLFRLPIDRVFAVAGAGTVVTGSTWTGTVAVGDAVRLLPLEREVRVRSIEVHGQAAERA